MQMFYIVYHKQPEVIRELVMRGLLPVSVLRDGQMPPDKLSDDELEFMRMERLMRHDYHQRVSGAIKQRGWGV